MKISVVTIAYNSAKTIEAAIRSVLSQDAEDLEYIIIDGKSTDATMEIVGKYSDQIAKIVSEPDGGISDAFNKGIRMATGEFIVLVNSDDELLPGAIQTVCARAADDADIVHGNIVARNRYGDCKIKKPNCDYELLKTKGMYLNHPGMFIRRRAYEKFGLYSTGYKCAMDRELLARMQAGGAVFQYIDREFALFQSGGESTKHYFKHAMPESKRITMQYGVSPLAASMEIQKKKILFMGSCVKTWMLGTVKRLRGNGAR